MLVIDDDTTIAAAGQLVLDWMRTWTGQFVIVGLAVPGDRLHGRLDGHRGDLVVLTPRLTLVMEVRGTAPDARDGVLSVRADGRWRLSGYDGDPIPADEPATDAFDRVSGHVATLAELAHRHAPDARVEGLVVVVPPGESDIRVTAGSGRPRCGVVVAEDSADLRAWFHRTAGRRLVWSAEDAHGLLADLGMGEAVSVDDLAAEGFPTRKRLRYLASPEYAAAESAARRPGGHGAKERAVRRPGDLAHLRAGLAADPPGRPYSASSFAAAPARGAEGGVDSTADVAPRSGEPVADRSAPLAEIRSRVANGECADGSAMPWAGARGGVAGSRDAVGPSGTPRELVAVNPLPDPTAPAGRADSERRVTHPAVQARPDAAPDEPGVAAVPGSGPDPKPGAPQPAGPQARAHAATDQPGNTAAPGSGPDPKPGVPQPAGPQARPDAATDQPGDAAAPGSGPNPKSGTPQPAGPQARLDAAPDEPGNTAAPGSEPNPKPGVPQPAGEARQRSDRNPVGAAADEIVVRGPKTPLPALPEPDGEAFFTDDWSSWIEAPRAEAGVRTLGGVPDGRPWGNPPTTPTVRQRALRLIAPARTVHDSPPPTPPQRPAWLSTATATPRPAPRDRLTPPTPSTPTPPRTGPVGVSRPPSPRAVLHAMTARARLLTDRTPTRRRPTPPVNPQRLLPVTAAAPRPLAHPVPADPRTRPSAMPPGSPRSVADSLPPASEQSTHRRQQAAALTLIAALLGTIWLLSTACSAPPRSAVDAPQPAPVTESQATADVRPMP
ncbi:hypothetical protein IU418_05955 [Nocardia farcinica]|uniref:nuclease-related domain-containing protein n=1 Tax=Nocardia farcinica TaxID=37329 RepID=UPI001B3C627F|nr:nuclease-related domain-containing protein [Nocardia farcinica]MBF6536750.1 hypothetical protein [Nocardia farcinica]